MNDERDNRLVRVLEEIGARLDKLDRHYHRFERLEKKFEQAQFQMMDALEIASIARLQAQNGRERTEIIEDRQRRFEAGMEDLTRRVAALEDKSGPSHSNQGLIE